MGIRGRRRKRLLDDLKNEYWKFKEEAVDLTLWRAHLGRGYGSVARETTQRMQKCLKCYMEKLIQALPE
jgi:hypothetical protein